MRIFLILAAIAVAATTVDSRYVQSTQPVPLLIEGTRIGSAPDPPAERYIDVQVRSQAQRQTVAWGVRAKLTDAEGQTANTGLSIDGYEADVRYLIDNPVLQPGGSYTLRLPVPKDFVPVSVSAAPTFVIFDDNSAVGENQGIDHTFRERALNAAAWQFLEQTLDEGLRSATEPKSALQLVQAAIDSAPLEIRRSLPAVEVGQRIGLLLRRELVNAESVLRDLRAEVVKRRKAAATRSFRRQ